MTDPGENEALEFLREDQRKSGLTVRDYERKYGVILGLDARRPIGAAAEIKEHEVFIHDNARKLDVEHHCPACAPRERPDD